MKDVAMIDAPATREAEKDAFLAAAGWGGAERRFLAGDASFRKYDRVELSGKQAVLMDAPPEHEDCRPFIAVGDYLVKLGLSAPRILARDLERGFLLLEDLGDDSFTRLLKANPEREETLYLAAMDALAELHQQNLQNGIGVAIPPYDAAAYEREVRLFSDWFMVEAMGALPATHALGEEFVTLFMEQFLNHRLEENVAVLRDFHADNLLWLPERSGAQRVGLLDFQDALQGDAAYDVVSLLEDARRDVAEETVQACIRHYCSRMGVDEERFRLHYALLGAQRNLKIIGIFVRLAARDGRMHYPSYLPRVWGHLQRDVSHPALKAVKTWLDAHVPAPLRGVIDVKRRTV